MCRLWTCSNASLPRSSGYVPATSARSFPALARSDEDFASARDGDLELDDSQDVRRAVLGELECAHGGRQAAHGPGFHSCGGLLPSRAW